MGPESRLLASFGHLAELYAGVLAVLGHILRFALLAFLHLGEQVGVIVHHGYGGAFLGLDRHALGRGVDPGDRALHLLLVLRNCRHAERKREKNRYERRHDLLHNSYSPPSKMARKSKNHFTTD